MVFEVQGWNGLPISQYLNKKPLTVVKPGSQTRRFTHINDTVKACYEAFKANKFVWKAISLIRFIIPSIFWELLEIAVIAPTTLPLVS